MAGYYQYAFDYQWVNAQKDIDDYYLGDTMLPDFIVSDDAADFALQVARWIAHDDDIDSYLNGVNPVDRAVIVVADPNATGSLGGLHYMLLTEVMVRIPDGKAKTWANAKVDTYYLEDPAWGGRRPFSQSGMETIVNLRDSVGNKLLKHVCIGLYVGEKSLGRYQKGVRTPAEIAQVDWQGRVRYYADNLMRDRLRRILPAIMLLLDEE